MLLLSSHSAKHVIIDVYWFSTKLQGGEVFGVLEKKHNNVFGRFAKLFKVGFCRATLIENVFRICIFGSIFLYFSSYWPMT